MAIGAIVALQANDGRAGEILVEAENVIHLGAAPAIDRLVIVADAADVGTTLREQPQPHVLRDVGILILIHQHEFKAAMEVRQHIWMLLEQPQTFEQQIAEVAGVEIFQPLLIGRVE